MLQWTVVTLVFIRQRGESIMRFDIRLDGYIVNCDKDYEDFMSEFVEWLESNGWGYAGMSLPVTDEEDIEAEIQKMVTNDHYKKWGTFLLPDDDDEEEESE
jgi:hypothetical protein